MSERFNSSGPNGRSCPLCFRVASLAGDRGTATPILKCGGCHARFKLRANEPFGQLERLPVTIPKPGQPFASAQQLADYNAGARLADDHFCQGGCGRRGVIGTCSSCGSAA